ncbi:ankyrin repeat domain-containing protein [Wolbachia endosymbiont of Rhagoletis cerasi]|uniref:ankyrin repeat domain-containing protein n=1 Tax=Wolbachia endosymbiont of Rhagoletis cerasi TaxID=225363 RepID=UPI001BD3B3F6|nr:ankyrin repeat domain-containing protein [Wolbachia endosymbiont of Rhagoletis cerasi]MBS9530968.1 ankyrin repeat domain-containing protein [Wolbachia endosymbiont of Rhagoletis cerasi]
MEKTLGNNPVPNDKEFIKTVIDAAKDALETKFLRKNELGEYDAGYPTSRIKYGNNETITIPKSIGYIKLLIDNFCVPLEEKKQLLVTLMEQNPELVREKLPVIRKELGNSDILNKEQFEKKELYVLLNSIDDSEKINKLFKEISGLDIEKVWREQKEFVLLKQIYIAATTYGEGSSACIQGTWSQIINSINEISTEILAQYDDYLKEEQKLEAQKNTITEENIKPFMEDLAKKLIEYIELYPELKQTLEDFAASVVDIDEPEEITLEQEKILAEINKYFSQNIKKYLQNYDRNIPSRNAYDLIIKGLSEVGVMQRFVQEGQAPSNAEDNSNSYATIGTDEELFKFQAEEIETKDSMNKVSMDLFTSHESNSRTVDAITNFSTVKKPALGQESKEHVIQEDFIQVLQPKSSASIGDSNIQFVGEITPVLKVNADRTLHHAAEIGDKEEVKALIEIEEDINSRDKYGSTPLHYAASKGHIEILRSLLDAGAKFDEKDNVGMTPLCLAIVNDYQEIVETLVEKGANVNVVSKSGKTPLEWLSISRHTSDDLCSGNCSHREIEEILLKNGAVGNTENSTIYDNVQAKSIQLNNPENKSTSTISDQLQTLTQRHAISSDNEYEQAECSVTIPENQSNFRTVGGNSVPYSSEEQPLLKVSASDNKQGVESGSESESEDNKSNITVILADTKKEKQTPTHKQDVSTKDNSKSKPKENNVISQNKKMHILAASALGISGIISGIAIAVYLEMLAVGVAVGACCLVVAAIIHYCNKPLKSLENSNDEAVVNQITVKNI